MCELQELFDKFEQWLRSWKISVEDVHEQVWDRIVQLLRDFPGITPSDFKEIREVAEYPKERWPKDKLKWEKSVEFLARIWWKFINDNPHFTKNKLREPNLALYRSVSTYISRWWNIWVLSGWWNKSSKRTKEEIDALLKQYRIEKPEDAFRKWLSNAEAQRLYNAAKNRAQIKKLQN